MKKIHLLPNLFTAFGLTCGLFAIFKINVTPTGMVDEYVLISLTGILILAAFADLLDGALARAMKAESDFGGFFDSMADAVTFGVSPSVIVLKTFSFEPGTEASFWLTMSVMIFSVCGVLRLVRFTMLHAHAKGDEELMADSKKNFTGLPIPAAAFSALSTNLFLMSHEFHNWFDLSLNTKAWIMSSIMICIGYLMICRWKFPSLKTLRIRIITFPQVFMTVLSAIVIFFGLLHRFSLVFFIFSWLYIFTAVLLSIIRLISGKKSSRLIEFEPEPEEEWKDEI